MINGHPLLSPPVIPANCVCKLESTFEKPWRWEVEVWGTERPYKGVVRRYQIPAIHEQAAAQLGMERYSLEMFLRAKH
jgi:hypothetical protein